MADQCAMAEQPATKPCFVRVLHPSCFYLAAGVFSGVCSASSLLVCKRDIEFCAFDWCMLLQFAIMEADVKLEWMLWSQL